MKGVLGLVGGFMAIGLFVYVIDASTDAMAVRSSLPMERSQGGGIPVADMTPVKKS
jgi:hypothetical protein